MIQKTELRKKFLSLRNQIPEARRKEASLAIAKSLQDKGRILTFYSIGSEIDLSILNSSLAKRGQLIANRLEQNNLVPYHVENEEALLISHLRVPEPDPALCKKASLCEIDLILVPGLTFDKKGHRLGFGKGCYDRLLSHTKTIPSMGVGFLEQLSESPIPIDAWDVAVKELALY